MLSLSVQQAPKVSDGLIVVHAFPRTVVRSWVTVMERLEPTCFGESIGQWYWQYLGIQCEEAALSHRRDGCSQRPFTKAEEILKDFDVIGIGARSGRASLGVADIDQPGINLLQRVPLRVYWDTFCGYGMNPRFWAIQRDSH